MTILSEIITNLYIGSRESSTSGTYKLVVNCTEDIPRHIPHISDEYINLRIDDVKTDAMNDKIFENLMNVTQQIYNVHHKNEKILVHCHMGISRSVTVVVAYIIRYTELSLIQAIVYVKNKRPLAFSYEGVNFEKALIKFATALGKY